MVEMTPMQSALWASRQQEDAPSAHLYAEFDIPDPDPDRLEFAVQALFAAHPMLRLRITPEGQQIVQPAGELHRLQLQDLRKMAEAERDSALAALRKRKTHQRLRIERGQAAEVSLSLLPDNCARLHVDIDMIAADPSCFGMLMDDLARFYETGTPDGDPTGSCYFAYRTAALAQADRVSVEQAARRWWQGRLDQIAPAPNLPQPPGGAVSSTRLAAHLSATEAGRLRDLARAHRLTFSNLLLAAFCTTLAEQTGQDAFRLSMPLFHRPPLTPNADRLAGDFTGLAIISARGAGQGDFPDFARRISREAFGAVAHAAYSGVSVLRDLSRRAGRIERCPIVFTAGVDLPRKTLLSRRVERLFGPMIYCISQGDGVALDAQVAAVNDGLLVNWDIREDLLPSAWVKALFDAYLARLRGFAAENSLSGSGSGAGQAEAGEPLTPLQMTYLLGRSDQLPLGGVAMQEIREYRGEMSVDTLRKRLAALQERYSALRTTIDATAMRSTLSAPDLSPHFSVEDLRQRTSEGAEARLAEARAAAQEPCALSAPPWQVQAFRMPETCRDPLVVLACFDALILDGAGIAQLMAELFSDVPVEDLPAANPPPAEGQAAPPRPADGRAADHEYWRQKLADVGGPPTLPWQSAPDQVARATYAREEVRIPAEHLAVLTRRGAQARLFGNSILSALVLEVLACWAADNQLVVGIPIAPHQRDPARLRNDSSFIALHYDAAKGDFADRAARVQSDIMGGLSHARFGGVAINRLLLSRQNGRIALPVVLTNGLSWSRPSHWPMRLCDGLTQTPQVALDLRLTLDADGDLRVAADYAREALDAEVIRDILAAITRAVGALVRADDLSLESHDFLPRAHLCHNTSGTDLPAPRPYLAQIAQHLYAQGPEGERPALIRDGEIITRAALGHQVAATIAGLRARGLRPGSRVAICLPRGPEHIVTALACALDGIIRIPLDTNAPPERLRVMLEACAPDLVVTDLPLPDVEVASPAMLSAGAGDGGCLVSEAELRDRSLSPEPAYQLFTSGSTGEPKRVVLSNRATAHVITETINDWRVSEDDVMLSVTPLHHDMSVFDVFGILSCGGTLVLPGRDEDKDAVAWNRLVAQHGVSIWCSVPAILEMLLFCGVPQGLRSLRLIAQGGDYVRPAVIDALRRDLPQARLISLGGPTETTVWSIWHEISAEDTEIIPYGRPLAGNSYFICDARGAHCPPGVVGRIHTAGVNLALGYEVNGALDQTDFITLADPEGHPVRAYRSGDLGRFRHDGTILFAGRVAGYVKLRGVRVSLADVEAALASCPGVEKAIAVDIPEPASGDCMLAALYTSESGVGVAEIRAHARRQLPLSHVPQHFFAVDRIALTSNGKPDRHKVRDAAISRIGHDPHGDPTRPQAQEQKAAQPVPSALQERVLGICRDVLGSGASGMTVDTPLITLGLRPSHLAALARRLSGTSTNTGAPGLRAAQLIPCRTVRDLAALAATHLQETAE